VQSAQIGRTGKVILILSARVGCCEASALEGRGGFGRSECAGREEDGNEVEDFEGCLGSLPRGKDASFGYHEGDKFIIIVYSSLPPLQPVQPLRPIQSMSLLHIIMINKNQSKRNSVPEEQF
jgi:hypothetical protein